jgi:iron complex outermembrane receptor protein
VAGFVIEETGPDELLLQLGLRYDFARYTPRDTTSFVIAGGETIPVRPRTFGAISGSLGFLWHPTELLRVGASASRAYRTPDLNELFTNGPHLAANSFDVGDPSLGQETGLGFDVFVRLSHDRVSAEVAAFRNTLTHYIFPSSRGRADLESEEGVPRFQYTNEDARFVGIEGEFLASPTDLIRIEASGSLVRALFTSDRAPIPVLDGTDTIFVAASGHPPLIPPAQGRIGLRLEERGRFLGIGIKLVSRQDRVGDFEAATQGYALLDATAGLRTVRGGLMHTITFGFDNLLDREFRDHMSRVKDFMPGAGRSASLHYRITF